MKRKTPIRFICAHPVIISCVVGSVAMSSCVAFLASREVSLRWIYSDALAFAFFVLAIVFASLLGAVTGMLFIWPFVRAICARVNGSRLMPGDKALILAGAFRGTLATVHRKVTGQGGWELAELRLLPNESAPVFQLFEEYQILKVEETDTRTPQVTKQAD